MRDSDRFAGVRIDIGAVECGPVVEVDTTDEQLAGGTGTSLHEAIASAEVGGRVVFDSALSGETFVINSRLSRIDGQVVIGEPNTTNFFLANPALMIDASDLAAPPTIDYPGTQGGVVMFSHPRDSPPYPHPLELRSITLQSIDLARGNSGVPRLDVDAINAYDIGGVTPIWVEADWANLSGTDLTYLKAIFARLADATVMDVEVGDVFRSTGDDLLPEVVSFRHLIVEGALTADSVTVVPPADRAFSYFRDIELAPGADLAAIRQRFSWFSDCVAPDGGSIGASSINELLVERCAVIGGQQGMSFSGFEVLIDSCLVADTNGGAEVFRVSGAGAVVRNTTISGNRSVADERFTCNDLTGERLTAHGSSVVRAQDDVLFENCTIFDNRLLIVNDPEGECGSFGVYEDLGKTAGIWGEFTLKNTIVARNVLKDVTTFPEPPRFDNLHDRYEDGIGVGSSGHNLIDTAELGELGILSPSDLQNAVPWLLPLGENGGPLPTHLPLAASPAIDAVPPSADDPLVDARGYPRAVRGSAEPGPARLDIGAVEATVPNVVSTELDSGGAGSLRDALTRSVAAPFSHFPRRVVFQAALSGEVIEVDQVLVIDRPLSVDASALAAGIAIDGTGATRILRVQDGIRAALAGVSFRNGKSAGSGGAILNRGELFITHGSFESNAANASGGAIANGIAGSELAVTNCSFSENSAPDAAVFIDLVPSGMSHFRQCTFTENSSQGAALFFRSSDAFIKLNLFADQADHLSKGSGTDLRSGGWNLSDIAEPLLDSPVDLVGITAGASSLGDNGGVSRTAMLLPGSNAIDAGHAFTDLDFGSGLALLDGRGFVRELMNPSSQVDIGAYEVGSSDRDGDLIPDDWEVANGLDPDDPADAGLDFDFDGITNIDEFRGGTLPWDNYSRLGDFAPKPRFEMDPGGQVFLVWDSDSITPPIQSPLFFTYQIESSTDLGRWDPLGLPVTGSGSEIRVMVPFDLDRQFFRIAYRVDLGGGDWSGGRLERDRPDGGRPVGRGPQRGKPLWC